ncbi:MAG: hypothetical protein ABFS19_06745 [Thermodesulfobacteriota bacterium]
MRQIVIDDLSPMESDNIDSYLKRHLKSGPMIGLYWLQLPPDLLSEAQQGHDDCGPFYLGVELARGTVRFELLVRSTANLHCSCIAHATPVQRNFVLEFVDRMCQEEMIKS